MYYSATTVVTESSTCAVHTPVSQSSSSTAPPMKRRRFVVTGVKDVMRGKVELLCSVSGANDSKRATLGINSYPAVHP